MIIDSLSEPIRRYIRDKRWEQLRPIQAAAITRILASSDNFILASRTASGKTEAAFLPILSKVNFQEPGVQVLYISPLIALINDQFYRIEDLCKYLDVTVTKWHGESNRTLKEKLLKSPKGVVLITPESIEAMFVNKPFYVPQLFSNLKYIVIDEIHSFIGTDRGTQLKSILSRLQFINVKRFSVVGLSATIGDPDEAKKFTGDELNTKVLVDKQAKDINAVFRFFEAKTDELSLDLMKDLYLETKDNKVLIFPNSRGRAEEVAVKLKKISQKVKGHINYFSHHSSVDKDVREYVEYFAKNNTRQNFCISCTSTLELGIDIGTVDEVVQIDATNSIASLIQRVGRSGRKDGESSNLFLYATNQWSLLQSLACWLLYKAGFIEPQRSPAKAYDILLHQALSITKGHSGIRVNDLITQLHENFAFNQIDTHEIEQILNHLIEIDFLEKLQQEVIIGIEGERVVNSREFYSVFKTEENFKVVNAGSTIGNIPFSPQVREDENILLAAKIWKIRFIDFKSKKIEVTPTNDGKKPMFFGSGSIIHPKVREKMIEILFTNDKYEVLNKISTDEIESMRKDFSIFNIKNVKTDRPLQINEKVLDLYTFTGTRINRTIQMLLNIAGLENTMDDRSSSFEIKAPKEDLLTVWSSLSNPLLDLDPYIADLLESNPALLDFSKWGIYLPRKLQIKIIKEKYFDVENTGLYLKSIFPICSDNVL
ncbi:MAG TPA: DEAD/DEAH box helicase [Saprospiraceae bacterium]|nr:DEAD/DEAH box helicase [Saprospiraceae bacterium]